LSTRYVQHFLIIFLCYIDYINHVEPLMVVEINHILLLQGVLQDQSEIAVKHLLTNSQQGIDEFLNEIVLITSVRHKNLVKLKGCCLTGGGADKRLLVFEFVDNNNLAETIFGKCFHP
jgi:serine/threonine protein kinase